MSWYHNDCPHCLNDLYRAANDAWGGANDSSMTDFGIRCPHCKKNVQVTPEVDVIFRCRIPTAEESKEIDFQNDAE